MLLYWFLEGRCGLLQVLLHLLDNVLVIEDNRGPKLHIVHLEKEYVRRCTFHFELVRDLEQYRDERVTFTLPALPTYRDMKTICIFSTDQEARFITRHSAGTSSPQWSRAKISSIFLTEFR